MLQKAGEWLIIIGLLVVAATLAGGIVFASLWYGATRLLDKIEASKEDDPKWKG